MNHYRVVIDSDPLGVGLAGMGSQEGEGKVENYIPVDREFSCDTKNDFFKSHKKSQHE